MFGFGMVYASSLTFVYVEGDDASAIMYHVLGRDPSIWPPYAAYNGMMDTLLSFLPAQEAFLRIFAISLSAVAGLIFAILTLYLVFEWLEIKDGQQRAIMAFIALLAVPEQFFLGLIYDPALIGMAFVMGAHLVARRFLTVKEWRWRLLLCSALLFGFGVSLRWSVITYGLVVAADLIFFKGVLRISSVPGLRDRFTLGIAWGVMALLAASFFILVSGQGAYLVDTFVFLVSYVGEESFSLFSLIGLQTLITPAVALLSIIGLAILLRRRIDLVLIVLAGGLSILPVWTSGTPKDFLTAIPALMLCVILGLQTVLHVRTRDRWFTVGIRLGLLILLLAPWVVGVKLHTANSLWGPGFEMRKPGDGGVNTMPSLFQASVGAKDFSITGISVAVNDGMALATPEGPRPMGAYASVLLDGRWRAFVSERDRELQNVVEWAILHRKPLLIDSWNSLLFARIIANDYRLTDSYPFPEPDRYFYQYTFENTSGVQLLAYSFDDPVVLVEADRLRELMPILGGGPIPLITENSSMIQECYNLAPEAVSPQSPFVAILDLKAYRDALK